MMRQCSLQGAYRTCLRPLLPAFIASPRVAKGRSCCITRAVGWDPEGILAAPIGGHIARRSLAKQVVEDKELAKQVEAERERARAELQKLRDARVEPTTHAETVQYFLETERDELEYEAARRRPLLTPDFFVHLTQAIGEERFGKTPNAGRMAELERLQEFLQAAVAAVDETVAARSAPVERLRKLLSATDKKATLLQMAGDNEIDRPLLDLLQQNIDAATAAGQTQAAEFMGKVRAAAMKFLITA